MKKFNDHTIAVFTAMNTDYESMNNLMQDFALGREIYDAESDRVITKAEANAKILDFSRQILGITDIKDVKATRRALRDNHREWFDIIEDTVDKVIEVGLKENDWFQELVEYKSIAYGDRQDFVIEEADAILSVAKAGTSHNDHYLQRLRAGQTISISTDLYVVKVGADINKFLLGDIQWDKLVNAIAIAFTNEIQNQVYSQVAVAVNQLPARFKGNGTLVKTTLDSIIQDVAAYNSSDVIIMGSKAALSKISAIADVQWAAQDQKNSVMNTGNIGIYEGTRLVQLPVRFKDSSLTGYTFPIDELLILPVIGDTGKFIKALDEGDTQIIEQMERTDYLSDFQTYQVSRRFGVGCVLGRYFGDWKF